MTQRFQSHIGTLYVSAETLMELKLWLVRAETPFRCQQAFGVMVQQVNAVDVNEVVAHRAAQLGSRLARPGTRITSLNLLVAGTATLVTHTIQRFTFVSGLTVVDWLVP